MTAGTPIIDTGAFPSNGCTPASGYSACITDDQLRTELRRVLSSHSLPSDLAHFYPMFFPPGVETKDRDEQPRPATSAVPPGVRIGHEPDRVRGHAVQHLERLQSGQAPNALVAADGADRLLQPRAQRGDHRSARTPPRGLTRRATNKATCAPSTGRRWDRPPVRSEGHRVQPGDQRRQVLHPGRVQQPRVRQARGRQGLRAQRGASPESRRRGIEPELVRLWRYTVARRQARNPRPGVWIGRDHGGQRRHPRRRCPRTASRPPRFRWA